MNSSIDQPTNHVWGLPCRSELRYIHTKLRCGSGLSIAMTFGGKAYFLAACLVVVFGLGQPVLAVWAFVCIRFFELLQLTFGKYIMSAIYWMAETKISVQRLSVSRTTLVHICMYVSLTSFFHFSSSLIWRLSFPRFFLFYILYFFY